MPSFAHGSIKITIQFDIVTAAGYWATAALVWWRETSVLFSRHGLVLCRPSFFFSKKFSIFFRIFVHHWNGWLKPTRWTVIRSYETKHDKVWWDWFIGQQALHCTFAAQVHRLCSESRNFKIIPMTVPTPIFFMDKQSKNCVIHCVPFFNGMDLIT